MNILKMTMVSVVVMLSACAWDQRPSDETSTVQQPPKQYTVDFDMPGPGWRKLDVRNDKQMISELYIPKGASADDLSQFINFEILYHRKKSSTIKSVALQAKQDAEEDCKQVTWDLKEFDNHDIYFTLEARQCESSEDYMNVGHLFSQNDDYYFLYYSAHFSEVPTKTRDKIAKIIFHSTLKES